MRESNAYLLTLSDDSHTSEPLLALPADMMRQARQRLERLAVLFGTLNLFALALTAFDTTLRTGAWVHITSLSISTALFTVSRSRKIKHSVALNLALVCQVCYALLVSVGVSLLNYPINGLIEATWTCILIVAFPLLVPLPPRRMLVAAVACALTVPFGLWVLIEFEGAAVSGSDFLGLSISPTFCVVIAYFGSRVIYGFTRDVARARQLGSYKLESILGKGGMGEVWRARHRMLARPAAVKLIRPDRIAAATGEESLKRFEREAQVTAALKSPHTVELYDFGQATDGTLYYVMELLDGIDLQTLVEKDGPLPAERVIHVLRQVCHSLAEAHVNGLVHRDVKPANIFLCQHGLDLDVVKVLDFGLVALEVDPELDATRVTAEGRVPGTPAFMAPEMVTDPDLVDGRADVYSLGATAFYLLTGRPLFTAKTPMKVMLAHVSEEPCAPSDYSEVPVPNGLDALILSCLAKDPDHRPGDMLEVAIELEAIDTDECWTKFRMARWWSLHRPGPHA